MQMEEWLEGLNNDSTFTGTMERVYTDMLATGNGYTEIGRTTTGDWLRWAHPSTYCSCS